MVPTRTLRPRSRVYYNNEEHGQASSLIPGDDRCIEPKIGPVQVVRPSFTKPGPCIFRPWPTLDPQNPSKILPGRRGVNANAFNEWLVRAVVVKYVGIDDPACVRSTFILYEPWRGNEGARETNPYIQLYYACSRAMKSGRFGTVAKWDGDWNKYMAGGKGSGAALGKATHMWFAQGIVFANMDNDYTLRGRTAPLGMSAKDYLTIIELSGSAGDNLFQLMSIRNEKVADPDPAAPSKAYVYGDPTGIYDAAKDRLTGGVIVKVFSPEMVVGTSIGPNTSWDRQPAAERPGQVQFKSFHIELLTKVTCGNGVTYTRDLDSKQLDLVRAKAQFWFTDPVTHDPGVLRVPSDEEQCVLIARGFSIVPQLLEFGWADHPEYFSDDVKGILRHRHSVVTPGLPGEADVDSAIESSTVGEGATAAPTPRAPRPPRAVEQTTEAADDFGVGAEPEATEPVAADPAQDFNADPAAGEEAAAPAESGSPATADAFVDPDGTPPFPGTEAQAAAPADAVDMSGGEFDVDVPPPPDEEEQLEPAPTSGQAAAGTTAKAPEVETEKMRAAMRAAQERAVKRGSQTVAKKK